MPKDYIQISLGLQEFSVLNYNENETEIVVTLIKALSYEVCPCCGESTNKVHQIKERLIEDIPIQNKRLWLKIMQRRFKCLICGKVLTETFQSLKPRSHRTLRYEQMLYEKGKTRALKDVALEYQVKYTTYRRIWYRCAQEMMNNRENLYPRIMGIDEFSVAKHHNYHTVLTDLEKHLVVTTLEGRNKESLKKYLDTLALEHRPEIFVVDIWKGYISAIKDVCPLSVIVADKFHLIRMANQALDLTRRIFQYQTKKGKKRKIYLSRHLLLRASERLSEEEKMRLLDLFRDVPRLGDAYELKELLRDIYREEDYKIGCSLLRWWCQEAQDLGLPGFRKLAGTILRWFEIITNYFKYRVTNGFTEGMNNKIKLDKRRSYGYRNFFNQRLRILAQSA